MVLFRNKRQSLLRATGFLDDQQGILNRYYREAEGWQPHLNNTREFILQTAEAKGGEVLVVLGSGWLLDVPLQELREIFRKIFLVDMLHPPQVKHKVGKMIGVELIEADITGGIVQASYDLLQNSKRATQPLMLNSLMTNKASWGLPSGTKPDLVLSVNMLNQLDNLICEYLGGLYAAQELTALKQYIQKSHLEALPAGGSCLITDHEVFYVLDDGTKTKPESLVHVVIPEGVRRADWQWDFDKQKTYWPDRQTFFNVVAIEF